MSVFEVRGGNDRRSMIKRYERKAKQDAIRELVDLIHCNWSKIEQLEAASEMLRGLTPTLPPRPPEGEGLPRYGLRWNGPQQPLSVPMEDGYWTPWHLAAALDAENAALKHRCGMLGLELENAERDALAAAPAQDVTGLVEAISPALHWAGSFRDAWPEDSEYPDDAWVVGAVSDGEQYPIITVNADQYDAPGDSEKIARAIIALLAAALAAHDKQSGGAA